MTYQLPDPSLFQTWVGTTLAVCSGVLGLLLLGVFVTAVTEGWRARSVIAAAVAVILCVGNFVILVHDSVHRDTVARASVAGEVSRVYGAEVLRTEDLPSATGHSSEVTLRDSSGGFRRCTVDLPSRTVVLVWCAGKELERK